MDYRVSRMIKQLNNEILENYKFSIYEQTDFNNYKIELNFYDMKILSFELKYDYSKSVNFNKGLLIDKMIEILFSKKNEEIY